MLQQQAEAEKARRKLAESEHASSASGGITDELLKKLMEARAKSEAEEATEARAALQQQAKARSESAEYAVSEHASSASGGITDEFMEAKGKSEAEEASEARATLPQQAKVEKARTS